MMADQLGGGHLEGGARPCRGDATALEHGHLVGLRGAQLHELAELPCGDVAGAVRVQCGPHTLERAWGRDRVRVRVRVKVRVRVRVRVRVNVRVRVRVRIWVRVRVRVSAFGELL